MDDSPLVAALSLRRRPAVIQPANSLVARFYDRVLPLYPAVDIFCGPARRRLIAEINRQPAGRLLEIGVGPGAHVPLYRAHGVTVVDCSAAMIASCRRRAPHVAAWVMDGEALAFPNGHFDYLVLCHVLSVTADASRLLGEVHRVLRRGGLVFVLNHETPAGPWRYVERLASPVARWLRFRSWFRLGDIAGVERFHRRSCDIVGCCGLICAHVLEK